MKQSIHCIFFTILSCLVFTACNKDEEQEFIMSTPPIGKCYLTSESIVIKFESTDSVSFYVFDTYNPELSQYKGRAKYIFDKGNIEIRNEDNKNLSVSDVLNTKCPYFLFFKGKFINSDTLTARFNIYGYHYQMLTLCDVNFHIISE